MLVGVKASSGFCSFYKIFIIFSASLRVISATTIVSVIDNKPIASELSMLVCTFDVRS